MFVCLFEWTLHCFQRLSEYLGPQIRPRRYCYGHNQIVIQPHYEIDGSVGKILGWEAYLNDNRTVTFQIWRNIGLKNYMLIGQTVYETAHDGMVELTLAENETYHVQKGDVMGMYFHKQCNIPHYFIKNLLPSENTCIVHNPGKSVIGRRVNCTTLNYCRTHAARVVFLLSKYSL